jgi:6-phosphogluconolactonase (cycloisomerase 2 family)
MTLATVPLPGSQEPKPWLAFVGSRTTRERNARGAGLSVYAVDKAGERWELLQTVALVNPSYLCVTAPTRRLYVVHGDHSEVSSFAIAGDGRLQPLNQQSTRGRNPVHLQLSGDGRHLVVANYATGSLASLPIQADGSLGEVTDLFEMTGTPGPHRVEQKASHPHQALRWPGTDLFVAPNKGLDRVHVLRLGATGRFERLHEMVARSCSGPRHAAFDPARSRIWVCNELDSTVTTCELDPISGRLQPRCIVSLLPDDFMGENRAAGIVAHPRGQAVYVSNRGLDAIAVLQADATTGALTPRQWMPSLGTTPRFITLTPDAGQLIVANEGSDTLVRHRLDADGLLGGGDVVATTGSPVCVAFLDAVVTP